MKLAGELTGTKCGHLEKANIEHPTLNIQLLTNRWLRRWTLIKKGTNNRANRFPPHPRLNSWSTWLRSVRIPAASVKRLPGPSVTRASDFSSSSSSFVPRPRFFGRMGIEDEGRGTRTRTKKTTTRFTHSTLPSHHARIWSHYPSTTGLNPHRPGWNLAIPRIAGATYLARHLGPVQANPVGSHLVCRATVVQHGRVYGHIREVG